MKIFIVPLIIFLSGVFIAIAFLVASREYPTVGCLMGNTCYIPGNMPLWNMAPISLIVMTISAIIFLVAEIIRQHYPEK